jgi:Putative prokaryotic signal transducing protein
MRKLLTFGVWERPVAGLLKDRLEQEGIACLLKNNDLVSVMGEIPMVECYPELWVVDGETWPRAKKLLDLWLQDSQASGPAWICPSCNEPVDAGFDACWNCNHLRPEDSGSNC